MTTQKCVCKQEAEIGKLRADVNQLLRAVMGNGQPGLIVTVPRLAETVESFEETARNFALTVSEMYEFQQKEIGRATGKAEIRRRTKWVIGILVTLSTSLLGTVVVLMLKLLSQLPQ